MMQIKLIDTTQTYTNPFGDTYFQEINNKAFDTVGATATFNKVFNKVLDQEGNLFIIVGSDSGLLIPYLQESHSGKGRHYLIIERPEIIDYIQEQFDIDETLIDLRPDDLDFGTLAEEFTDYVAHNRYMLLRSLAVVDGFSQNYRQLWESALDRYNIFSATESGYAINNIFIDSQLRDLAANEQPAEKVSGSLKGLTAVIMGGGPSLDDSIDWIKTHQDKLVIFAAARIANRLKKEGIQPDFFVTVDPHAVSYDNSKQMLQFGDSAILVHSNNANSKLLAEWSGVHAYLGLRYPWIDSQHKQPSNLNIVGPTVTNTMASVAGMLRADQILLSGVDFCYGEGGKSYESESIEAKTGKYLDTATNRVETYSGRIAETTPSFANARKGMEDYVRYAIEFFENRYYTLSQETALMENVDYIATDDIVLGVQEKHAAITHIKQQLSFELKPYQQYLKEAKAYCQEMRDLCKNVTKLAKQGKKAAKKLFVDLDKTDQLTQEIIHLQKQTNESLGEHAEFVFNYAITAYKDFMDPKVTEDNMTQEEIKNSFIHYFSGLIDSAIPLRKSIESAIQRLNVRIKETQGTKHFDQLIEKWAEDNEEGRPLVWLKMNQLTLADLSPEQQAAIQSMLEIFEEELHQTETKLSQQIKSQGESPATLLERIRRYFAENRVYELEELVNYIAEQNIQHKEDLCAIGTGFVYELKDMPDDALEQFIKIQDQGILLEGLKRVVSITLHKKDYDTALNALEVLTHYSDEYFIAYADILGAMGDTQGAVEIYFHYLQSNDSDTATWIKVAKLLIHNGMQEEAINAIQKIQKLEPENPVASELMNLATQPKH